LVFLLLLPFDKYNDLGCSDLLNGIVSKLESATTTASITVDIDETRRHRERHMQQDIGRHLGGKDTKRKVLEVKITYIVGNGNQVTQTATVVTREGETVYAVHFEDIPSFETINVMAIGPYGDMGTTSFLSGDQDEVSLVLEGIGDISPVSNFDFFEGSTDGWKLIGPRDSFRILPHIEVPTPDNIFERGSGAEDADEKSRLLSDSNITAFDDYDLVVSTNQYAPEEVSASYVFDLSDSESTVMIRYRFVADTLRHEGTVDTDHDDYYHMSIRSTAGTSAPHYSATKSILGLGTDTFDIATGSTPWMTASVSNITGIVEVRVTLGKVGKGDYQSHVVIDYVEEI
jgi:hypothetical protein